MFCLPVVPQNSMTDAQFDILRLLSGAQREWRGIQVEPFLLGDSFFLLDHSLKRKAILRRFVYLRYILPRSAQPLVGFQVGKVKTVMKMGFYSRESSSNSSEGPEGLFLMLS